MKYYSRSPQELQERLLATPCNTDKSAKRSRFILFLNLIIILMVFSVGHIYLSRTANIEPALSNARSFSWEGWTVYSKCNPETGCEIQLLPAVDAKPVKKLLWNSIAVKDGKESSSGSSVVMMQNQNQMNIPPVFSSQESVFISLFDENNNNLLRFKVYP